MSETITHIEKKTTLVPELRFKEFDGEWTKTELENLCSKISDGIHSTPKYDDSGTYFFVNGNNLIDGKIEFDDKTKKVSKEEFEKHKRVIDDCTILMSINGTIGNLAFYNGEDIMLGKSACYINVEEKYRKYFIYYVLQLRKTKHYFFSELTGTTIKNLSLKTIKNLKVPNPSLPEQQKIASFLSAVDEKIQQLTLKKELLEDYKKGVMQQIFSQQIRFKDENGNDFPEWEEKRLDNVVSKFIVPMRDKPKSLKGPIPWCRIEDFEGMFLSESKSNQGVDEQTIKEMNLKVYPIGTLLVSCSANLGFCAITEKELITNQTFIGLVPNNDKVDVMFLWYVMRRSSHKLNALSSGTTISYLSREQFEKFKIQIPQLEEQRIISTFLRRLDDRIESIESRITKTQTFKKGLLQKMFV